mmetsp:Transcript_26543/g.30466  ORF Transcript_26543/g.30466 Transcript_26543/m.30466 type:complete len:237 (+) Transcript_26543:600-1310(+)
MSVLSLSSFFPLFDKPFGNQVIFLVLTFTAVIFWIVSQYLPRASKASQIANIITQENYAELEFQLSTEQIDANSTVYAGLTLLFYAMNTNNPAIIELLITHGADYHHVAKDGKTPLVAAVLRKKKLSVATLLKYSHSQSELNRALSASIFRDQRDVMLLLLHKGAEFHKQTRDPEEMFWISGGNEKSLEFIKRFKCYRLRTALIWMIKESKPTPKLSTTLLKKLSWNLTRETIQFI